MKNINKAKNRWLAPLLMTGFLTASCSIAIEETDSVFTEQGLFNGVASVQGSLDNIYNAITGEAGDQANLYSLTEVSTDEVFVPTRGTDWGDNGVWRTVHDHTWSAQHEHVNNVWNNKNRGVLRCTEVIDPLSKANPLQLAEAKFARAYNMWIVMDFWGQVPFRNATDGPDVIPSVLTRTEAYDFIVKDLTEAIADLPNSAPSAALKRRPVKATARFFLAKVKLNAAVYKGSYGPNDLQDVINLVNAIEADGYSLVGNYFNIFPGTNTSNTDVIWSVDAGAGNRMWNGLHYSQAESDNTGGGWNGFSTFAEFYDKFEGPTASNSIGLGQEERRGYTHTPASTNSSNSGFGFGFQLGQMYGWRYRDKNNNETARKEPADVKPEDKYVDPIGYLVTLKDRKLNPLVFTKEVAFSGNDEVKGMRLLKYSPANGAFLNGVVMARFADAHLMRAEALLRLSSTSAALTEVNELRALRANTPSLASLDLAELLDERARELYLEGWRRNDMIRFGVFKAAKKFKPAGDGHTDLFPIPAAALLTNPNLKPNPGY
jgi:starch-binding outer membrane protein, SusD/RagB family